VPQRFVQRHAAHDAAAYARADDMDIAGFEEPAGLAVAAIRGMGADRGGEMLSLFDEIGDEGDKDGEGAKGCGDAGPSPR
jgi:hypothetical protein